MDISPQMQAFYRVYRGLDREGPGLPDDVLWALDVAQTPEPARICDAGCGSGADTVTLAQARPNARVAGVERAEHLAAEARGRLADAGLDPQRVSVQQGDFAELPGPFDLVWCAGALYFMGVTQGLKTWRNVLADGAAIAFSEPCFLKTPASPAAARFWADYQAITDLDGICQRVTDAGYRVVDHRMIQGAAWEYYYDSLTRRIAVLRSEEPDPMVQAVIDETAQEIANWQAAPDQIAYALLVVRPA